MTYCSNCGKELAEGATVCQNCGAPVATAPEAKASAGWWWLGFLFPVVGFILWLALKRKLPKCSKKAGIGCLVGVIVLTVLLIILFGAFAALGIAIAESGYGLIALPIF